MLYKYLQAILFLLKGNIAYKMALTGTISGTNQFKARFHRK